MQRADAEATAFASGHVRARVAATLGGGAHTGRHHLGATSTADEEPAEDIRRRLAVVLLVAIAEVLAQTGAVSRPDDGRPGAFANDGTAIDGETSEAWIAQETTKMGGRPLPPGGAADLSPVQIDGSRSGVIHHARLVC